METRTPSQSTTHSPLDSTLALLSDPRRREVVSILSNRNPPVSVGELATRIAARELGADPDEVPSDKTGAVVTALHHVHLPKLADNDLVAYDAEEGVVTDVHLEDAAPFSDLREDFDI